MVAALTLMPSTSTSTWSVAVPRKETPVACPRPPLLLMTTPGSPRSTSIIERDCRRSISERVTTLTGAKARSAARMVRVAVTTTGSRVATVSAASGKEGSASGSASAVATRRRVLMLKKPLWAPHTRWGRCLPERRREDDGTAGPRMQRCKRGADRNRPPRHRDHATGRSPGSRAETAGLLLRPYPAATPSHGRGCAPQWLLVAA